MNTKWELYYIINVLLLIYSMCDVCVDLKKLSWQKKYVNEYKEIVQIYALKKKN